MTAPPLLLANDCMLGHPCIQQDARVSCRCCSWQWHGECGQFHTRNPLPDQHEQVCDACAGGVPAQLRAPAGQDVCARVPSEVPSRHCK